MDGYAPLLISKQSETLLRAVERQGRLEMIGGTLVLQAGDYLSRGLRHSMGERKERRRRVPCSVRSLRLLGLFEDMKNLLGLQSARKYLIHRQHEWAVGMVQCEQRWHYGAQNASRLGSDVNGGIRVAGHYTLAFG